MISISSPTECASAADGNIGTCRRARRGTCGVGEHAPVRVAIVDGFPRWRASRCRRPGTRSRACPARPAGASAPARAPRSRRHDGQPVERGDRHHDRIDSGGACSRRVSMLPWRPVNWRSGRSAASCAVATDLHPVATQRARGEPVERAADQRVAWVGGGRDRGQHEPRVGGRREILGRVHRTLARPSRTACSTSFTNTPVPPSRWISASRFLSPRVEDDHELRPPPEQRNDPFRLPPRERRPPSSDLHAAHQINDFPSRVCLERRAAARRHADPIKPSASRTGQHHAEQRVRR